MPDVARLRFLLVLFAGWVNRHSRDVIEYLLAENRVLRAQLKGRPLIFTSATIRASATH